jgi:hypothetical protein
MALAHYVIVYARAWAADSINARVRLAAENDQLHEVCALLREELRIKDTRMAQIVPQRRPHYAPHERMVILELRAARGWSLKQTTDTFLVKPATVTSWAKRIPLCTDAFHEQLAWFGNWYNQTRPHSSPHGRTPHEVYHDVLPACRQPRYEPREKRPRGAPCASPHTPVAGHCGARIRLDVRYHRGRKHLPIVELPRAA